MKRFVVIADPPLPGEADEVETYLAVCSLEEIAPSLET